MAEFYSRIKHKRDTEANWNKAINFIPLDGELIIYTKVNGEDVTLFKIGDGTTLLRNLPFVTPIDPTLTQKNAAADAKTVGELLKTKMSASVSGEKLIFT